MRWCQAWPLGVRKSGVFQGEGRQEVAEGIYFFWIWEHLECLWLHLFAVKSWAVGMGCGLCSFPAVWYVVPAVLCMQFLVFPDAVNIFPVSLQSFARLCSQAVRAGGFPRRESIADAGCTCSKARDGGSAQPAPPRGPAGCAASPAARPSPALPSTSAALCLGFGQFAMV